MRAPELDLLTFIVGRCLWFVFVVSGSSFGGGCRVSLFGFLPWVMLFSVLRGLPSCVVCSQSNLLKPVINKLVSSAKRTILLFLVIIFGRSFM